MRTATKEIDNYYHVISFSNSILIMALLCAIALAVVLLSFKICIQALLAVLYANRSCKNIHLRLWLWRVNSGGVQARHSTIQHKASKIQWRTLTKAMVVTACGLQLGRDCGFCKFLTHFGSRILARERCGARIEMPHDLHKIMSEMETAKVKRC